MMVTSTLYLSFCSGVALDNHKTSEKAIEQVLADFLKSTPYKKGGPKVS